MHVRTGTASSGDVEIHYEDMGDPNHPAVLLIMGLGAQLLLWRKGFCEKLVDQGLRVIRYDNRDVGLSTKLRGRRTPGSWAPNMVRSFLGVRSPAVYTLEDMADDAAALLDHLDIERAHVVGASMGGMIAQVFAARAQDPHHYAGRSSSRATTSHCCPRRDRCSCKPFCRSPRIRHARGSSRTRSGSARSSAARVIRNQTRRFARRRSRATTARTIRLASRGISARSSAAAACCATTAKSKRRPSFCTARPTS